MIDYRMPDSVLTDAGTFWVPKAVRFIKLRLFRGARSLLCVLVTNISLLSSLPQGKLNVWEVRNVPQQLVLKLFGSPCIIV